MLLALVSLSNLSNNNVQHPKTVLAVHLVIIFLTSILIYSRQFLVAVLFGFFVSRLQFRLRILLSTIVLVIFGFYSLSFVVEGVLSGYEQRRFSTILTGELSTRADLHRLENIVWALKNF